jgi:antitoxin CptB
MDKLLGSFVKKHINTLKDEELQNLCNLLDYDDDNLYKFNQGLVVTNKIKSNKVTELFRNYEYVSQ